MKISKKILLSALSVITAAQLFISIKAEAAETSTPVGFIAGIHGKGYIVRGDSKILISGMDLIYPADKISLLKGSTAKINICGKSGYEIHGEAECVIRAFKLILVKGKPAKLYAIDSKTCSLTLDIFQKNGRDIPEVNVNTKKGSLVLRTNKKERKGVLHIRGVKKKPDAIEILNEKILASRPLFIWSKTAEAKEYRVNIIDDNRKLWSTGTFKNYCKYPGEAPLLENDGSYSIKIEALSDKGMIIAEGETAFTLYSKEEDELFQKDESEIRELAPADAPEMYILLGKFYESYGLVIDAVSCYEKALLMDKGNTGLHERIVLINKDIK